MSKGEKKYSLHENFDDEALLSHSRTSKKGVEAKKIRHVHPLGMRVLVRIVTDSDMSEGGLYLPEGAKSNMAESLVAEVVEVASATDDRSNEETNISGIPLGARILIGKHAGVRVPWDDKLRIVDSKDVLAMVDEVNLS